MSQFYKPPDFVTELANMRQELTTLQRSTTTNAVGWVAVSVASPFVPNGENQVIQVTKGLVFYQAAFLWSGNQISQTISILPQRYRPRNGFIQPIAVDLGVSTQFGAVTISDLGPVTLVAQPSVPDAAVGYVSVIFARPESG